MSDAPQPVLVTGAAGFAGSHLVELLAAGGNVVAWARSIVHPRFASLATWQAVDLLDRTRVRDVIRNLRPSVIYHCAGLPHVAESWGNTAKPLAANVLGTHHLLDAVRRAEIQCRVLVPGSAAVYAASPDPISEDGALAPASPYALSKLAQEQLSLRASREDGIEIVLTRSFNHTGARQSPAFVAPSLARQIALIEAGAREPVIQVGNLDAERDLTDVRDVVRAYAALVDAGTPATVYNVASGVRRSIRDVVEALVARSRVALHVAIDRARLRPADVPALIGDATRLREATGWRPQISFDQMLDDLLDYWRAQIAEGPSS